METHPTCEIPAVSRHFHFQS